MSSDLERILALSHSMKEKAHCPYSNFRVGAALLCENGEIFTGCNVENLSFGISTCAERTAVVKAVSEGNTKFKAIAIASDSKTFISPCGPCRQTLAEFVSECTVYMTKPDGTYKSRSLSDLLPDAPLGGMLEEVRARQSENSIP